MIIDKALTERFSSFLNSFVIPKSISKVTSKLVSKSPLITPNISNDSLRAIYISAYIKAHHISNIRISFDMVERLRKVLDEEKRF